VLAFVSVGGGAICSHAVEAGRLEREGAEVLRELRSAAIDGDYHLRFELKVLPRRGKARVLSGELWGSRNAEGPVSRVALYDGAAPRALAEAATSAPALAAEVEGAGAVSSAKRPARTLLIQNGVAPRIWVYEAGMGSAEPLPESEWHAPLLADAEISAFDLLMPYLYWEDFDFEGGDKVLGRAAYRFLFREPVRAEDKAGAGASPSERLSVRAYFDQQFHALLQSKLIGPDGAVTKTLTVRDLQKKSGQWMLKSIDLRNERTRDKTRFEVREAELGLELEPRLFKPEWLGEPVSLPESKRP